MGEKDCSDHHDALAHAYNRDGETLTPLFNSGAKQRRDTVKLGCARAGKQ
jgi:hypothetical protein